MSTWFIFCDDDANAILQIPLASRNSAYLRVLHFATFGICSVRSAYHVARELRNTQQSFVNGQSSNTTDRNWDWIWHLRVPNKIKVFTWKVMREASPVLSSLHRRHIKVDNICHVQCWSEVYYPCYEGMPLLSGLLGSRLISLIQVLLLYMWEWFRDAKQNLSKKDFKFVVCSCWSLWSNRNKVVHQKRYYDPMESVHFVRNYIHRFHEAQTKFSAPRFCRLLV